MTKPPKGAALTQEQMEALTSRAVPLGEEGILLRGDVLKVYVVGKHPLLLDRQVIEIPFSVFLKFATFLVNAAIVPTLIESEKQVRRGNVKAVE